MPEEFYKHANQLRTVARLKLFALCFALVALGLAIEALSVNYVASIWLAAISITLFWGFLWLNKAIKNDWPDVYETPIPTSDIENVLSMYHFERVAEDAYVLFCSISGFRARVLILEMEEFGADLLKKKADKVNRVINRKYEVSQEISMSDSRVKFRITLCVVKQNSKDLRNWVSKNTSLLLQRSEAIVRAAVVMDDNMLLFPSLHENVRLNELNKYVSAAEIIIRMVGKHSL